MSTDDKAKESAPGTGGLSLEPPPGGPDESLAIGFAPDLAEDGALLGLPEGAPGPVRPPRAVGKSRYPLAESVLDRLLGADAAPPAPAPEEEATPAPFVVGAPIMRPPADIVQEPPEPAPTLDEGDATQGHLDDMVEVVLVGKPEDGKSEIHLLFKEDVLQGLYLILERRDDGLFARFTVGDDTSRRAVLGRVDELVARLRDRGMAIAGYDVAVRGEGAD